VILLEYLSSLVYVSSTPPEHASRDGDEIDNETKLALANLMQILIESQRMTDVAKVESSFKDEVI
jgi:enamine deaminase RidA (YjgF/YER057c/UK114 family)